MRNIPGTLVPFVVSLSNHGWASDASVVTLMLFDKLRANGVELGRA